METARVQGLRLAYRRSGRGRTVFFVHGGAQDGRAWTPQLEALSDEFSVIAWDEPGAGGSDDVPDGFGLADYADCLAGLIRTLGASPASIVGLSWGTTVILELYRRHPEVVRSMVLAGGYAGWRGSLGAEEAEARLAALRPGSSRASSAAARLDDASGDATPGLFAGDPPADFVPLMRAMAAQVRPQSASTALVAMAQADLTDVLPTIRVPTQLIWGARDARSPLSVAREFERRIADARLDLIPGCGHVSNLEAPESFTDLLRAFLREHA